MPCYLVKSYYIDDDDDDDVDYAFDVVFVSFVTTLVNFGITITPIGILLVKRKLSLVMNMEITV